MQQGAAQVPAPLYAAALRVALLPWDEPPQAVAASLPDRLKRGKALARVMGVAPSVHQEVRQGRWHVPGWSHWVLSAVPSGAVHVGKLINGTLGHVGK